LLLRRHDDAVVVLGVLEIALGHDQVAGGQRIARQRHVFLGDMGRRTPDLNVGTVGFVIPCQRILGLAATAAAAPAILLSLPHGLLFNLDRRLDAAICSLVSCRPGSRSPSFVNASLCTIRPPGAPRRRIGNEGSCYSLVLVPGAAPTIFESAANLRSM